MLQIAMCDDEEEVLTTISTEAERIIRLIVNENYTFFRTTSPFELIKYTESVNIDILLIDIEMPNCNGFELLKNMPNKNDKPLIIFITNMEMYVYESFKFHPFRFIRKTHLQELKEALESAIEIINARDNYFYFHIKNRCSLRVKTDDIVYFESQHNNLKMVMLNEVREFRSTLKVIQNEIKDKRFVRIYSSILLNIKYIYYIDIKNLEVFVVYDNIKTHFPVSRNNISKLLNIYKLYMR